MKPINCTDDYAVSGRDWYKVTKGYEDFRDRKNEKYAEWVEINVSAHFFKHNIKK